jgi:uncharacterized membrane protein YwzB
MMIPGFFLTQTAVKAGENFGLTNAAANTPLATTSIESMIGNIILSVLGIVAVVFFILIIWSGLTWMTAGGNDEKIGKAKKTLTAATVGLIIVVLGYSITYFVTESLLSATSEVEVIEDGGG